MFLGTHFPRLDDKGRLVLPAKFRDALATGLVLTKGQDRSIVIWPAAEFAAYAARLDEDSRSSAKAQAYQRVLFSGASDEIPDRQGRPRRMSQVISPRSTPVRSAIRSRTASSAWVRQVSTPTVQWTRRVPSEKRPVSSRSSRPWCPPDPKRQRPERVSAPAFGFAAYPAFIWLGLAFRRKHRRSNRPQDQGSRRTAPAE